MKHTYTYAQSCVALTLQPLAHLSLWNQTVQTSQSPMTFCLPRSDCSLELYAVLVVPCGFKRSLHLPLGSLVVFLWLKSPLHTKQGDDLSVQIQRQELLGRNDCSGQCSHEALSDWWNERKQTTRSRVWKSFRSQTVFQVGVAQGNVWAMCCGLYLWPHKSLEKLQKVCVGLISHGSKWRLWTGTVLVGLALKRKGGGTVSFPLS